MKYTLILASLFVFVKVKTAAADEVWDTHKGIYAVKIVQKDSLYDLMEKAWDVSWTRFYSEKTNLFYDYLSSYEKGKELAHLPNVEEVKMQKPNLMGYDTGMEDCMISAGTMLSMIVDKYRVTQDTGLRKYAGKVFQGIKKCATAHGDSGFLARCVCIDDARSIYITSSRDQYTHVVHGLWYYYHSPLCDPGTRSEIEVILSSFADRMKRNVTKENQYDFLKADGTRDARGISKMWEVQAHEAARLPMIYAAAWDVTGKQEYYDLYRSYINEAITQSSRITDWKQPTYSLLQMECSLELLASLETDKNLSMKIDSVMSMVAAETINRSVRADTNAKTLDLTMPGSDWRTGEGLNPKGSYRKSWYCIRESGEAALAALISARPFPEHQKSLLEQAILRLDYDKVSSNGIFYLQAAYWKARERGVFQ